MSRRALWGALLVVAVLAPRLAFGQERGAAALDQLLRGITVTGRVLHIGAHPDDEDTNLLAMLARGHQVHTAYLSLTRGDGGQNLIGNELGDALGAIRTEELLSARRVDGAQQFFSRAYDFGFSKSAEETFTQWDREALTGDVVRVIRAFRPQVVVAVWTGTRADGHGHHEASGILARDGFDAAADTLRFPVATHGRPWTPQKFYRSARGSRGATATLTMDAGRYDPVLGRSAAEIAGESRSQHRSQGFGALERLGTVPVRLTRELTRVNADVAAADEHTLFDGVDTTAAGLATLAATRGVPLVTIAALADSLRRQADYRDPGAIVPGLARLVGRLVFARETVKRCGIVPITQYERINGVPAVCDETDLALERSVNLMLERAQAALLEAAGVVVEVTTTQELLAFGDGTRARLNIYNRGRWPILVGGARISGARPIGFAAPLEIAAGTDTVIDVPIVAIADHRPYWIGPKEGAMFPDGQSPADGVARVSSGVTVEMVPRVSVADDARRLTDVRVEMAIAGTRVTADGGSIVYRFADPVLGEQRRPVGGVPPITIRLDRTLEYMRANEQVERRITVTLRSHTEQPRTLRFRTLIPEGLRGSGLPDSLVLAPGATQELALTLTGRLAPGRYDFGVGAESDGTVFVEGFATIEYPHIRPVRLYRQSSAYLLAVPVSVPRALRVAYVVGVSDGIAPVLSQLQIPTTAISADQLALIDLEQYTTVVIGPRAYDANPELAASNPRLFEWVRKGGTLVVQYGQYEMQRPGMTPAPIGFSRPAARVTREDAPVRVLDAQSRLLRWPNRITDADWADWVQERALYMPTDIDSTYRTPLAMNDPDEDERRGALLELRYGQGRYVYTSLSLFRQIPGGVPGGARLLVNLLSAGLPADR
ncbi:MAG: PIG-L family deacetylase [Gemmatimonadaceae bacterium]|nr:PIG-L family deacetylase [Gemmatimonadaceae bacterium]